MAYSSPFPGPKKRNKNILVILILSLLISIFPIAAITNLNNNTYFLLKNTKGNSTTAIETISYKFASNTTDAEECASVIIYSNNNSSTYGYRRDSTDSSEQYINKIKLAGEGGLMENNTKGEKSVISFVHSLILDNGWYIGIGGLDNPKMNKKLEKFGISVAMKGNITNEDMKEAFKEIKTIGGGHFVIKSPAGQVGVTAYFHGRSLINTYELEKNDYIVVPNDPNFFFKGSISDKKCKPVDSAFYLLSIDKFGVNRRNILVWDVQNITGKSKLDVYVANDDGLQLEGLLED